MLRGDGYDEGADPTAGEWLAIALRDLEAGRLLWERRLYEPAVFHCHEAIEKLLKALCVERHPGMVPPKVHDLLAPASTAEVRLEGERRAFVGRLAEQYIPTRYGEPTVRYSDEDAQAYVRGTEETFAWLRQQLS